MKAPAKEGPWAIGASLPLAVGIAISPVPIVAMVLMLTSSKARANGPAFIAGWPLGLGIVGAIVLAVAGQTGAGGTSAQNAASWESWLKIALGVLLLWDAVAEFRARPRGEERPKMPKWMATVDRTTPVVAVGLGYSCPASTPRICSWRSQAPPPSLRPASPGCSKRSRRQGGS